MLAKDPNHRFPTPAKAAKAVHEIMEGAAKIRPAAETPPAKKRPLPEEKPRGKTPVFTPALAAPIPATVVKQRPLPVRETKAAAPAPQGGGEFDVELLRPPAAPERRRLLPLSNRDWLLFAAGVVSAIVAGSVGILLAWLLRTY
jgi:hypothetical protein